MSTQQQNWIHKVAIMIIAGVALFMLNSMWKEIGAVESGLASHELKAAQTYVPREELIRVVTRLERTIREAIQDAKSPDR